MLSAEDHPGIFTFMVGLTVLVMAGVGLSLLVDRRFKFSSGIGEIQREIRLDASELAELESRKDEGAKLLAETGTRLHQGARALREVSARLESVRQRQADLAKGRTDLSSSIALITSDFTRYRAGYRRATWAGAVGEKLGTLTVRGGREYMQATITRVTDVGLEIHHEHGIARLQGPDLAPEMQDRFQWSDEERRSRLKEELENQEGKSGEPVARDPGVFDNAGMPESPAPKLSRIPRTQAAADVANLNLLRHQVISGKVKVSKLSSDRMEASSRASNGNQSSVPGSLETWHARAARLGRELARARAALEIAKSNLGVVAPGDPLLRHNELDQ